MNKNYINSNSKYRFLRKNKEEPIHGSLRGAAVMVGSVCGITIAGLIFTFSEKLSWVALAPLLGIILGLIYFGRRHFIRKRQSS